MRPIRLQNFISSTLASTCGWENKKRRVFQKNISYRIDHYFSFIWVKPLLSSRLFDSISNDRYDIACARIGNPRVCDRNLSTRCFKRFILVSLSRSRSFCLSVSSPCHPLLRSECEVWHYGRTRTHARTLHHIIRTWWFSSKRLTTAAAAAAAIVVVVL